MCYHILFHAYITNFFSLAFRCFFMHLERIALFSSISKTFIINIYQYFFMHKCFSRFLFSLAEKRQCWEIALLATTFKSKFNRSDFSPAKSNYQTNFPVFSSITFSSISAKEKRRQGLWIFVENSSLKFLKFQNNAQCQRGSFEIFIFDAKKKLLNQK